MQAHSKIDDLLKKQKETDEKEKKKIENLKMVCKDIFKDTNGKFFLKFLMKMCFWAEQDTNINNEILIYKKGRRDIWAIIRNIIPRDILAQIEIYDDVLDEGVETR